MRFGLFPFRSPLLRESRLLSLPAGTEMFHFPALPSPALCVQAGMTGNYARQVSLFGNPRITVWLPTPRGLSQAPTSFIGSWCQGIHRAPLSTWRLQLMLASTMQFSRYGRPRDKTRRIHGGQSRSRRRNNLARSLRTQQRAKPDHHRGQPFLPSRRRGVLDGVAGELTQ